MLVTVIPGLCATNGRNFDISVYLLVVSKHQLSVLCLYFSTDCVTSQVIILLGCLALGYLMVMHYIFKLLSQQNLTNICVAKCV